jgi:hypothetical protein
MSQTTTPYRLPDLRTRDPPRLHRAASGVQLCARGPHHRRIIGRPRHRGSRLRCQRTCRSPQSRDLRCALRAGRFRTTEAMIDEAFMAEIRRLASGARYLTSVCTGSLILGAAGMLRGKGATTHWATHDLLDTGEGLAVTHNQAPRGAPLGRRRSNISSSGYRRYLPAAPGLIPGLRSFGRPRLDGRPPSFGPAASAALR